MERSPRSEEASAGSRGRRVLNASSEKKLMEPSMKISRSCAASIRCYYPTEQPARPVQSSQDYRSRLPITTVKVLARKGYLRADRVRLSRARHAPPKPWAHRSNQNLSFLLSGEITPAIQGGRDLGGCLVLGSRVHLGSLCHICHGAAPNAIAVLSQPLFVSRPFRAARSSQIVRSREDVQARDR